MCEGQDEQGNDEELRADLETASADALDEAGGKIPETRRWQRARRGFAAR
jgi:hypothetical protein